MYKRLMLERGVVLTYWEVERRGFALVRCVIRCGGTVWWYGVVVRCDGAVWCTVWYGGTVWLLWRGAFRGVGSCYLG